MLVYWAFGTYWGNARANNKKGHLVGHIKDIGHDPKNPETRLYATTAAQPWHNDAADLVSESLRQSCLPLTSWELEICDSLKGEEGSS